MAGDTALAWANRKAARRSRRGTERVAPTALGEAETLVDARARPGGGAAQFVARNGEASRAPSRGAPFALFRRWLN